MLNNYFKKWENQQNSISDNEYDQLSDTIHDVYEIYKDFFTPLDIKRIGKSEWGDSIYIGKKYYIIQSICSYSFTPTLDKKKIILNSLERYKSDSLKYLKELSHYLKDTTCFTVWNYREDNIRFYSEMTITNFRPKLDFLEAVPLYYDSKYHISIANFISVKKNKFRINRSKRDDNTDEIKTKWAFINQAIYIYPEHWGDYWEINTCPYVKTIVFDYDRTTAIVFFSLFYQGGQALYKKINGKWTFIKSELTLIQ